MNNHLLRPGAVLEEAEPLVVADHIALLVVVVVLLVVVEEALGEADTVEVCVEPDVDGFEVVRVGGAEEGVEEIRDGDDDDEEVVGVGGTEEGVVVAEEARVGGVVGLRGVNFEYFVFPSGFLKGLLFALPSFCAWDIFWSSDVLVL